MESRAVTADRQSAGFLLLYALAYAGGVVAYTPFLMLVLPARVSELAGEQDIVWLGYIVFVGAIAASLSGILFGWLSDRTGRRRPWIAAGLAMTIGLQLAMSRCDSPWTLLWLVVTWQFALNMMLVPLIAWAGDLVPDTQKGILGGLLSIAPAVGAWSGIMFAGGAVASFEGKSMMIAALTAALVFPLLIWGRPANAMRADWLGQEESGRALSISSAAMRMWGARLLMQISGAALASYLYFWLRALDPALGDGGKTLLFAGGLSLSILVAMVLGRWTDKHGYPFAILAFLAVITATALAAMALAGDAMVAKIFYVLFATVSAAFLALHGSQTLRVLPRPESRARGIGIFNLTNTAPSLIMPWIAISVVPGSGFGTLFLVLALLALIAAALLASMARDG